MEPRELSYAALCEAINKLPPDKQLSQSEIDDTLYQLISLGYLSSFMEQGDIIYMVQIARRGDSPIKRDEQKLWHQLDLSNLKNLMKKNKNKDKD